MQKKNGMKMVPQQPRSLGQQFCLSSACVNREMNFHKSFQPSKNLKGFQTDAQKLALIKRY